MDFRIIQRCTDKEAQTLINNFFRETPAVSLDDLSQMAVFQALFRPRTYAINKALWKFPALPLHHEDFLSVAWAAFEYSLVRYDGTRYQHKTFTSFFMDNVYYKSIAYCLKYTTTKHRNLNFSRSLEEGFSVAPLEFDYDFTTYADILLVVYAYLERHWESLYHRFFWDYLHGVTQVELCQKYAFPRHKVTRLLMRMRRDLSAMLV